MLKFGGLVCAVTTLIFVATFFISKRLIPVIYLLRAVLLVQVIALLYFALIPARFPHTPDSYLAGFVTSGIGLISLVPLIFGLTYYIFDFGLPKKALLTSITMAHLALFLPFQCLLQALVLQKTVLFMPVLYIVFGMPVDVMLVIGFYSWGMFIRPLAIVIVIAFCAGREQRTKQFHRSGYRQVSSALHQSGNFSGDILVAKNGKVIFKKSYGFADLEHRTRNTPATRFHIASMSMQFTAAAVLRLVDAGSAQPGRAIGNSSGNLKERTKSRFETCSTERSGLPDINALPDYDEILQHHQTPPARSPRIQGQPLLFRTGLEIPA